MNLFNSVHTTMNFQHFHPAPLSRLLLLMMLPLLTGCGFFTPTLHAVWATKVPLPNGFVETYPWEKAPTLTVNAHRGNGWMTETWRVQLKACTDGRSLSILVRWIDPHESQVGRFWVWDDKRNGYQLQTFPIDQCAILWPITPKASLDPWRGKDAVYDLWHWKAGWSDLSGYADDRRLIARHHPPGTRPEQVTGRLYPMGKRQKMVELEWVDDAGTPGTQSVPRPMTFLRHREMGAVASDEARGSVADVRAQGVYTPKVHSASDKVNTWRYSPQGDDWFLEFYRLLVTESKAGDDYQIRGRGPHSLAIMLWDSEAGNSFYITDPIRLKLGQP